ncbi:MAG: hypothetical protein WD278_13935 [Pirellulales bacterium]
MNLTIFRKGLILVTLRLLFQLAFVGLVARMQSEPPGKTTLRN